MSLNSPRFITPPTSEQERFPYHPVWPSLFVVTVIIAALTGVSFVIFDLLGIVIPPDLQTRITPLISCSPLIAWVIVMWLPEKRVPQPRQRLFVVVFVTGLMANSIGSPIISQIFLVDQWLPLAPAVNRIIGYTFTVGIVQEIIKYLVIRFAVWPDFFRTRTDGIAYGISAAIGYSTVLSLQFVAANPTLSIDVLTFRVIANFALHAATGIIIGFSLSEVYFTNALFVFQPIMIFIAALITGVAIPIHAGLVNAALSIPGVSAPRPLFGMGFSVGLLFIVALVIAGLIQNVDRLERESRSEDEL